MPAAASQFVHSTVQRFMEYMPPVVRASVTFLRAENGGRATMPGLSSGQYMPHVVVQPADRRSPNVVRGNVLVDDYLGVRFLCGPANPRFDEPLDCKLELMYHPDVNYDALREGASFTLREGGKVIGFGVITLYVDRNSNADLTDGRALPLF